MAVSGGSNDALQGDQSRKDDHRGVKGMRVHDKFMSCPLPVSPAKQKQYGANFHQEDRPRLY
jgi:hypothetical protein